MTTTQHAASCHSCLRIPPPSLLLLLLLLMISTPLTASDLPHYVTIPITGVYLITFMADPNGRLDMHLQVDNKDTGIVAYGRDGVFGGLTVAVPLGKGEKVSWRVDGKAGESIYMGVAWVNNNFRHFTTVRSNGNSPNSIVQYNAKLAPNRQWKKLNPTYSFYIPASGIYWVCARPECGRQSSNTVRVNYLFQAFCSDNQALSAAGAFYFSAGDTVSTKRTLGNSLGSATMLSFVRLLGNTRHYLKSVSNYMAFTAKVDRTGKMGVSEKLSFGGSTLTNYGHMYNKATRLWTIRVSGSYITSVRGAPLNGDNLAIELYNGDQHTFTYYSAKGSYSEQACIFIMDKDDRLHLKAVHDRTINSDTMMSIAFIWAKS